MSRLLLSIALTLSLRRPTSDAVQKELTRIANTDARKKAERLYNNGAV